MKANRDVIPCEECGELEAWTFTAKVNDKLLCRKCQIKKTGKTIKTKLISLEVE